MNKKSILDKLKSYKTSFIEELEFQSKMINFLENNDDFALRSNLTGQLTGSAWIINKERTKALLIHHKKLDKWLQIGGHIEESDQIIDETVVREVKEESGLQNIKLLSSSIYDIDIHTIPQKNDIAEHLHFDIRLIIEADENEKLIPQNEEVLAIKWCLLDEIRNLAQENQSIHQSMKRMIDKMQNF